LASSHLSSELPISKIALSLLLGFTFMLVVEQFHSRNHVPQSALPLQQVDGENDVSNVEFDVELEREPTLGRSGSQFVNPDLPFSTRADVVSQSRVYPLTLGLLVHGLADGLALGVSTLSTASGARAAPKLSFVVFLALLIHKGVSHRT